MTRTLHRALIMISLTVLMGSTTASAFAATDKIYAASMQDRLQYRGFSITRPAPPGWYVFRKEQNHTDAIFRRDLPPGAHTAFVSVTLRTLPGVAGSEKEFAQLARQDKVVNTQRLKVLSYHQKSICEQGQWAIEYEVTIRDAGAPISGGKPLIIHNIGQVIRQPTFPNGAVITNVSERGASGEPSSAVQAEGKRIVEGVRLESAPGRPLS